MKSEFKINVKLKKSLFVSHSFVDLISLFYVELSLYCASAKIGI